jgi:hypothetical protein
VPMWFRLQVQAMSRPLIRRIEGHDALHFTARTPRLWTQTVKRPCLKCQRLGSVTVRLT